MARYTTRQLEDELLRRYDAGDMQSVEVLRQELLQRRRGSGLDPLMQGLTLGFADELAGVGSWIGRTLAGAPKERATRAARETTEKWREDLAAYRERDPIAAFGLEMVGAGGPAAKLFKGLSGMRAFANRPVLTGIMTGAIEGGIAGVGAGEEEGRLTGGLMGAGFGAALPAALTLGGRGLMGMAGLTREFGERMGRDPRSTTGRVLERAMEAGQMDPTLLRARQRQLGPEASAADVMGPAGVYTAQGVIRQAREPGAYTRARTTTERRAAGAEERLKRDLTNVTDVRQGMMESLDEINTRQKIRSADAYDTAYSYPIDANDPKLISLMNRPAIRAAMRSALVNARNEGRELPVLEQIVMRGDDWDIREGPVPDMNALDDMKKALDRAVNAAFVRGDEAAPSLRTARNDFRAALDVINPEYRKAREIWAGDEALRGAMMEGEKILTTRTREVKDFLRSATDSEREAYLKGAMEAFRERMGRARSGEIGQFKFMETGNLRDKLRSIFVQPGMGRKQRREGQRAMAQLFRSLRRERTFAENRGRLTQGAETALRESAGESLQSQVDVPTAAEVVMHPQTGIPRAMIQSAGRAFSGLSEVAIRDLSEKMFSQGNIEAVIAELQRRGLNRQEIQMVIERLSRGGAMMAPAVGLEAGTSMGEGYAP